jgi:hypothetical protein
VAIGIAYVRGERSLEVGGGESRTDAIEVDGEPAPLEH